MEHHKMAGAPVWPPPFCSACLPCRPAGAAGSPKAEQLMPGQRQTRPEARTFGRRTAPMPSPARCWISSLRTASSWGSSSRRAPTAEPACMPPAGSTPGVSCGPPPAGACTSSCPAADMPGPVRSRDSAQWLHFSSEAGIMQTNDPEEVALWPKNWNMSPSPRIPRPRPRRTGLSRRTAPLRRRKKRSPPRICFTGSTP